MGRAVLLACLPWLALLVVLFFCGYLLVRLSGSRFRPGRLRQLHRDQRGGAQSLSFVLTLPLFVMIMLLIVQVSQLMIATVVVHYAAYAAARSAIVWIPAIVDGGEWRNCISEVEVDPDAPDNVPPLDPFDENSGPSDGGVTYLIKPGSQKYEKIHSAAVLACMPISPSRDLGIEPRGSGPLTAEILQGAYGSMVPDSAANPRIPARLRNKLAYAQDHTEIEIRFYHSNDSGGPHPDPPLHVPPEYSEYGRFDDRGQFYPNEVGWQDPITVTVKHDLALLPGPGRLLARFVVGSDGKPDKLAEKIRREGNVYLFRLTASATLGNEGETSVIPYAYRLD